MRRPRGTAQRRAVFGKLAGPMDETNIVATLAAGQCLQTGATGRHASATPRAASPGPPGGHGSGGRPKRLPHPLDSGPAGEVLSGAKVRSSDATPHPAASPRAWPALPTCGSVPIVLEVREPRSGDVAWLTGFPIWLLG